MDNVAFQDKFAKYLGAEILEVKEGYARVRLKIQKEFLNGVGTLHGGVIFSLADYAFALAANTSGEKGVAVNANINFMKPAAEGDEVTAEIKIMSRSTRLGVFSGVVTNQKKELLANFNSMAYFINPRGKAA